jgi:PTS system nitrogen regulatory IIA component
MMINVKEVAKLLNVTEKKVYRLIAQNSVPYYKIGEEYRFNRVELLEWATKMGIRVSTETFEESDKNHTSNTTFLDALKAGSINYNVDPEFLLQVLLAREKMGSTGIGEGIAIPHVRNPVVLNGTKAIISLCFLEHPIDFNSADKLPVTTLFTIISPAVRVHLQLLSHLGLVLQNPGFKAAIQSKASRESILRALEIAEHSSTS